MIESDLITFSPSNDYISMKNGGSAYLFKTITGARTALIHSKTETIYYQLITGLTKSRLHNPIELEKDGIDEYIDAESLVIQDIRVRAPSGGRVHIRITIPDREPHDS